MLEWDQLYIDCFWIHLGEEGNEKEIRGFGDVNDLETWTSDKLVDAAAVKALVVSNVSNWSNVSNIDLSNYVTNEYLGS